MARGVAAACEAALCVVALLFARGAASYYNADARVYALAALAAELTQLVVYAAALRLGPLAALRAAASEAFGAGGPASAVAGGASVVAGALFFSNLAYTPVGTTAAVLAARGGVTELARCLRAAPGARGAAVALYGVALFFALNEHKPFPARHAFVLAQAALLAVVEAAARAAARAARSGAAGVASSKGLTAAAERGLTRHALGAAAGVLSLAAAGAWSAGGGNAAAAARHAQSACHAHLVTAARANAHGAAFVAFAAAAAAAAAASTAAEARALTPPTDSSAEAAAEDAAVAAAPVMLAALLAALIFGQRISGSVMLAAVFIAAAAAAASHATHTVRRTAKSASAGTDAASPHALSLLWAPGEAWPRRQALGALAALYFGVVVGTAARRGLWTHPHAHRLASWSEAPDEPLAQCALPPALWHGEPYAVRQPRACDVAGRPFFNISQAPHYGTRLVMFCPGGSARYTPNFYLDPSVSVDNGDPETDADGDDVAGGARVAGVSRERVYDQAGPPVVLSHKVTHLELSCTQPRGADAVDAPRKGLLDAGHERTRREIALLPGPLARRLAMAGPDPPADPETVDAAAQGEEQQGDVARPNVIVFLLDALSRQTADSVLPDFVAALRGAEASFAPCVAASLEYEHFGIVGMNSKPNWAAMLCGGNCSGSRAVPPTATLPLLDAARAAGFATIHLNNFYPGAFARALCIFGSQLYSLKPAQGIRTLGCRRGRALRCQCRSGTPS
jgi:hypothetical protein